MSADLFPQGSIPSEWHDSFVGSDKIITLVEWLSGELSKHNFDEISTLYESFSEYIDGYCHPSHIYHSPSDEESDYYIGVLYAAHSVKEHYKYLSRVISLYHLAPHFSIRIYDAREAVRETFEQWVPPDPIIAEECPAQPFVVPLSTSDVINLHHHIRTPGDGFEQRLAARRAFYEADKLNGSICQIPKLSSNPPDNVRDGWDVFSVMLPGGRTLYYPVDQLQYEEGFYSLSFHESLKIVHDRHLDFVLSQKRIDRSLAGWLKELYASDPHLEKPDKLIKLVERKHALHEWEFYCGSMRPPHKWHQVDFEKRMSITYEHHRLILEKNNPHGIKIGLHRSMLSRYNNDDLLPPATRQVLVQFINTMYRHYIVKLSDEIRERPWSVSKTEIDSAFDYLHDL